MAGLFESGELANPLVSAQPAGGSHQQVMSPTLGQGHYGTLGNMPSPPPGRDGHPGSQDATQTPAQVHAAGGVGFASDTAAGRASGGGDPAPGVDHHCWWDCKCTPKCTATKHSSRRKPRTRGQRQRTSSEARPAMDLSGVGVLGGIRSTGETVGPTLPSLQPYIGAKRLFCAPACQT